MELENAEIHYLNTMYRLFQDRQDVWSVSAKKAVYFSHDIVHVL